MGKCEGGVSESSSLLTSSDHNDDKPQHSQPSITMSKMNKMKFKDSAHRGHAKALKTNLH